MMVILHQVKEIVLMMTIMVMVMKTFMLMSKHSELQHLMKAKMKMIFQVGNNGPTLFALLLSILFLILLWSLLVKHFGPTPVVLKCAINKLA